MSTRLDVTIVERGLAPSRSRAEDYIKRSRVKVNGVVCTKASRITSPSDVVEVIDANPFVSRAALKIVSAQKKFKLNFDGKTVLDVGSSTGGFTQFALSQGAKKVIAVDVGTNQMHPTLVGDSRIELHEKTDIRDFVTDYKIDIVVCDVSFISLRLVVPHILKLSNQNTMIVLMCKPQFEAGKQQASRGVIKNEKVRREILGDFEAWLRMRSVIVDKSDSDTPGEKGNVERFFLVKKLKP